MGLVPTVPTGGGVPATNETCGPSVHPLTFVKAKARESAPTVRVGSWRPAWKGVPVASVAVPAGFKPGMGVKPPYEVVALGWRVWDPEAPKYTYWVVNVGMCGWVLGVVLLFARSGSFSGGVLSTTLVSGSKLQPTVSPAIERSRSMVSGLYTTNPGCISTAILTPWSAANLAWPIQ